METQHWIETTLDCGYINQAVSAQLVGKCLEDGRMLGGMMDKTEMFCGLLLILSGSEPLNI